MQALKQQEQVISSDSARITTSIQNASNFGDLIFRCNICGTACQSAMKNIGREISSCPICFSSVRMRGIVHCLSVVLFGESLAIDDFPERKDIIGIGLSDWETYANKLTNKFSYTNTYYHKEPMLDITSITDKDRESCDFIISTDVFEHVNPPVSRAFENAYAMLKPGGIFVFSVPYSLEDTTIEHFPELNEWSVSKNENQTWLLTNRTLDGRTQEFDKLVFHGGEGETLEMRVFCEKELLEHLSNAGFEDIEIHGGPCFEHGIYWPQAWSLPIVARKKK